MNTNKLLKLLQSYSDTQEEDIGALRKQMRAFTHSHGELPSEKTGGTVGAADKKSLHDTTLTETEPSPTRKKKAGAGAREPGASSRAELRSMVEEKSANMEETLRKSLKEVDKSMRDLEERMIGKISLVSDNVTRQGNNIANDIAGLELKLQELDQLRGYPAPAVNSISPPTSYAKVR